MTDEERIDREVRRRMEDRLAEDARFEATALRVFQPLDEFIKRNRTMPEALTRIEGTVNTIQQRQKDQGREIGELKSKVDAVTKTASKIEIRLAEIPGERNKAIDDRIDLHKRGCVDASGEIDTATAAGREEGLRLAEAARRAAKQSDPAIPRPTEPVGALVAVALRLWKPILVFAAVGILALLGLLGVRGSDAESAAQQAAQDAQRIDQTLDALTRQIGKLSQQYQHAPEVTFTPPQSIDEPTLP